MLAPLGHSSLKSGDEYAHELSTFKDSGEVVVRPFPHHYHIIHPLCRSW